MVVLERYKKLIARLYRKQVRNWGHYNGTSFLNKDTYIAVLAFSMTQTINLYHVQINGEQNVNTILYEVTSFLINIQSNYPSTPMHRKRLSEQLNS